MEEQKTEEQKKKEQKKVQIYTNQFSSFGFSDKKNNHDNVPLLEKIYNLLCEQYRRHEQREDIQPVSIRIIYSALLKEFDEGDIVQGLATLEKGKGGHCIIQITDVGIMPGPCFGILR